MLEVGDLAKPVSQLLEYKSVAGGLLVQTRDDGAVRAQDLRVVTKRPPSPAELDDLLFAWRVAKYVKSNAIVCVKDTATLGIGAGQMSRVVSSKIAALKAQEKGCRCNRHRRRPMRSFRFAMDWMPSPSSASSPSSSPEARSAMRR